MPDEPPEFCIGSSHGWLTVTDYSEEYYQIKVLDQFKVDRILPRLKRGLRFNQVVLTVPPDLPTPLLWYVQEVQTLILVL